MSDQAGPAQPKKEGLFSPSFWRSWVLFWSYTLLRFGLFGALWLILWLVGVGWLFAAGIAVVLSVPLSWVLLAKPRQAFAANLEQRVSAHTERITALNAELDDDHSVREFDDVDDGLGDPSDAGDDPPAEKPAGRS